MDTGLKACQFIIIIPHNDGLKPFLDYRQKLFSLGVEGSYSFPLSIPLAEIKKPFSREELKELAVKIREFSDLKNGKITSKGNNIISSLGGFSFFGPEVELPSDKDFFSGVTKDKIIEASSPPVLCCALIAALTKGENFPPAPALSFRAAKLTNLFIKPLACGNSFSFEWEMDLPVWLPQYKRKKVLPKKFG